MPVDARPSIVITGASKGIGAACTARLARDGYHVYAGVRSEKDGAALIRLAGAAVSPVLLDVTEPEQIRAAADRVARETGERGLHALVNNAGIAVAGPLEFLPIDELRRQLEINFTGQIAVTQACLPLLRRARSSPVNDHRAGRIVFMSSIAGRNTLPFTGAYSASKFALEAAADALRIELRPFGLDIAIVEPGVIAIPIWDTARQAGERNIERMPPEMKEFYGRELNALRYRVMQTNGLPPERVADAVAHALTSRRPRTRYVVGRDARARILLQMLVPDRVRDWIVTKGVTRMMRAAE